MTEGELELLGRDFEFMNFIRCGSIDKCDLNSFSKTFFSVRFFLILLLRSELLKLFENEA